MKPHDVQPNQGTFALSPLDHIIPRVYIRLILCIPLHSTSPEAQATSLASIKQGLQQTLIQVPFLGGTIAGGNDNGGRIHIAAGPGVMLRSKVLTEDTSLSYAKLRDAQFPLSSLDDNIVSPLGMLPTGSAPPVMAAQTNFVEGGLLLTVCLHHSALDAAGTSTVLKLWAGNAKLGLDSMPNAVFASLPPEALDRSPLMGHSSTPDANLREKMIDYPQYKLIPTPPLPLPKEDKAVQPSPSLYLPAMTAVLFHFPASALKELKTVASPPSSTTFGSHISTYDALCAFLWHSITNARRLPIATPPDPPATSMVGFAVDGRKRLDPPLPATYLGNAILYGSTGADIAKLTMSNLPTTASQIRKAITAVDPTFIRNIIGLVSGLPDVTALVPGFDMLGPDLAVTSWRDMDLVGLDWGERIGEVESVRIPKIAFDGACIVLPELKDGGLEVIVGLKNEAMDRLKADEDFAKFASVRCI